MQAHGSNTNKNINDYKQDEKYVLQIKKNIWKSFKTASKRIFRIKFL